jgi:hypothetical protein
MFFSHNVYTSICNNLTTQEMIHRISAIDVPDSAPLATYNQLRLKLIKHYNNIVRCYNSLINHYYKLKCVYPTCFDRIHVQRLNEVQTIINLVADKLQRITTKVNAIVHEKAKNSEVADKISKVLNSDIDRLKLTHTCNITPIQESLTELDQMLKDMNIYTYNDAVLSTIKEFKDLITAISHEIGHRIIQSFERRDIHTVLKHKQRQRMNLRALQFVLHILDIEIYNNLKNQGIKIAEPPKVSMSDPMSDFEKYIMTYCKEHNFIIQLLDVLIIKLNDNAYKLAYIKMYKYIIIKQILSNEAPAYLQKYGGIEGLLRRIKKHEINVNKRHDELQKLYESKQ